MKHRHNLLCWISNWFWAVKYYGWRYTLYAWRNR